MFGLKRNRVASVEMNDFYIRAIIRNGIDIENAIVYEYQLPQGVVENEIVKDEMAFYDVIKRLVKDGNISKQHLRFFVPDHSVMMRSFEHPSNLASEQLKAYVEMELGRTIHLPFDNPLIDVYDEKSDDGEAVIFAAPSEEVTKLMTLFQDASLHPSVVDVRALSNIRFLENTKRFTPGKTYLIAAWSIDSVSISIYSGTNVDFLRYQPIDTAAQNWSIRTDDVGVNEYSYDGTIEDYHSKLIDQLLEIEKILNFYRFSLNKGEKAVDTILLMGDNPEMDFIEKQIANEISTPAIIINDAFVKLYYPQFEAKHSALIGLALKGAE